MSMNQTKKLPDVYKRDTDSNNYKLIQLFNLLNTDFSADMKSIFHSRDINNATGKTLDRYGEMIGQARNGATDTQYRFLLLYKISKLTAESDCDSIIRSLSQIFGAEQGVISITENDSRIHINGITSEMANSTGYSLEDVKKMVTELLPVGVNSGRITFAGSLLVNKQINWYGPSISLRYPVLYSAWYYAQYQHYHYGKDVGLSGHGEVPEQFSDDDFETSGDYRGGTLATIVN